MVTGEPEFISRCSLNISILSGFHATDMEGKSIKIANKKACALLAYLALHPNNSESRERLVGLLWSDKAEEQARASLRQTVKHLNAVFDDAGIFGFVADRQNLTLQSSIFTIDLAAINEQIEHGQINSNLLNQESSPEKILYGFESLDISFGSWLHVTRQNWREKLFKQLEGYLDADNSDLAKKSAGALVNFDPTHEQAQRLIIADYANRGNTVAALRQYEELWHLLEEEYDAEPDEDTQALIVDIKSGNYKKASVVQSVPSKEHVITKAQSPTIFVKPSETFLEMEQLNYLSEGFRRELVASLVRFREWVTIDGPFTTDHKMTSAEVPIYEVQSSVLGDLDNPKLVLMLKDISTEQTIWSESVQLTVDSWVKAQPVLVRRMAIAMNIHLSASRLEKFASAPELSLDIYDRWLKGQELFFGFTPEKWKSANLLFESIANGGAEFAPVYSSMAQMKNAAHLLFPGVMSDKENHQAALELGRKAIRADPLDTRGHLSMGWSYAMLGQYEKSEISYSLAGELNENDPWTMVSAALGWAFLDHPQTALGMANEALKLSLSPSPMHWSFQATIRFLCDDYEGCVFSAEQANYSISNIAAWKAAALVHLDSLEEAKAECEKFRDLIRARWQGSSAPIDENISAWLFNCFPIKNHSIRMAFQDGLKEAGMHMPLENNALPA